MTKTKYYDLQMDDPQDDYDVEVVNANLKKIDEQMKIRENATDALQEPEFTVADKRENIASKEKISKILGKIAKFFTDLKTVAFTGSYKDLSNKPTSLPASDVSAWAKANTKPTYTKAEVGLGNVDNTADANKSVKYATSAGNATKVNNYTVNANVPSRGHYSNHGRVKGRSGRGCHTLADRQLRRYRFDNLLLTAFTAIHPSPASSLHACIMR